MTSLIAIVFAIAAAFLLPIEAFPGPPIRFGHECLKNAFGARANASTSWSYRWGPKFAIREKTWSSDSVRLTHNKAIACDGELTARCPQWIQVDFAKETDIYFVEFESWDLRSAPTKFRILGYPARPNTANDTEARSGLVSGPRDEAWEVLVNQISRDVPQSENERRRFKIEPQRPFLKIRLEIFEIVDSRTENYGYVTIKNLVFCNKKKPSG